MSEHQSIMGVVAARPAAPTGRRERQRQATRERIFRAALKLFAEHGVQQTTVENITEAADVGKGTFFNYFPTKEHVLAAFGEMQMGKVKAVLSQPGVEELSMHAITHRVLHTIAEEPSRSPALVRSLISGFLSDDPVRAMMLQNMARARQMLTKLIAVAQERGEVRKDCRAAELARYMMQAYFGTLLLWTLQPRVPLAARLDAMFDLLWAGLERGAAEQCRPGGRS